MFELIVYDILDSINYIWNMIFQSIIFLNFFHSILGVNMKSEILTLNKSICDMQEIIKRTDSNIEIAYLKLIIAKNQDRILNLLESTNKS